MRQLFGFIFLVMFLAFALTTGAILLVILAVTAAALFAYFFLRQKFTGKPPAFMRFYRYEQRTTQTPTDTTVIEAEYEEVEPDRKRLEK